MEEEGKEIREKPNISKLSRKVGEKIRRDKLNNLLTQLAEEIPTIKCAHRRPDKLAILRLTVSYLKLNNGLKKRKVVSQCLRSFGCLYGAAKQVTDGVMFIMTKAGSILFVSENIQSILGFHQIDVMGFNIEKFIHSDDIHTFRSQFSNQSFTLASFEDERDLNILRSLEVHSKDKNMFYLRMLHASKKRQDDDSPLAEYELMHFSSVLDHGSQETEQKPWIVAFMKPLGRESINEIDVKVSEFTKSNEFASLHSLDGTILATEHRASLFHGFMNHEMVGKSPYVFILDEDLESIALSHRLILKEDEIPVTAYRMRSQFNYNIYVQSRSVIVYDKWTKQPKCIVSVNTIYPEKDGKKLLWEQKQKLAKLQLQMNDTKDNSQKYANSVTDSPTMSQSTEDDNLAQNNDSASISLDDSPFCDEDSDVPSSTHSLCEKYEQQAKTYPELYSRHFTADESRSNCHSSVKRTFDDSEDGTSDSGSDGSGQCSNTSSNADKCSRDAVKTRHNNSGRTDVSESLTANKSSSNKDSLQEKSSSNEDSLQEKSSSNKHFLQEKSSSNKHFLQEKSSSNKDFLQEKSSSNNDILEEKSSSHLHYPQKKSNSNVEFPNEASRTTFHGCRCDQPILKGLLENHLSLSDIVQAEERPLGVPSNSVPINRWKPSKLSSLGVYAASADELQPDTETDIGASGLCVIQSPTDLGDQEVVFKSKFAQQLHVKHVKLRETLLSQKRALQYLHTQLQLDPKLSVLSEQEVAVQKGLLEKISEAEDQVEEQSRILVEIEEELLVENNDVTLTPMEGDETQLKG